MKRYLLILFVAFFFTACRKDGVNRPDFDVSVENLTFHVGDTVMFTFSGNPDFLTFYPGIAGYRYDFKDRVKAAGKPILTFTSYAQKIGTQQPSLQLLASTDLNGNYTPAGIAAATWTNLTNRAVFSSGTDNTPSGDIDLSDIGNVDKNIYLAFKKHDDSSSTLKPWAWTIRSFNINLTTTEDSQVYPVTTLSASGWLAIDVRNPVYKWTVSGTALTIDGGTIDTPENEDWVITNPLNLYAVKRDVGISLKTLIQGYLPIRMCIQRPEPIRQHLWPAIRMPKTGMKWLSILASLYNKIVNDRRRQWQ
ncbi:DUF5017 domain-containing protein [Paraflavitalea speifideaquila]|uniref:DUF5017 domain-containing protein n=1 Tax=Paraflavitalea speifideaquila TaxID=3076558 RepID=UPI0028E671A6|nr:DUF5017 domain-containing protein [Paraflavitalea speifideiaquila]